MSLEPYRTGPGVRHVLPSILHLRHHPIEFLAELATLLDRHVHLVERVLQHVVSIVSVHLRARALSAGVRALSRRHSQRTSRSTRSRPLASGSAVRKNLMPVGESKDCNRKPVAAQRGVGADRRGCPAVEVRPPSASSSCIPDEGRLGASWPMMRASPLNVDASCICSLVSSLAALGLKSCFGGGCCWLRWRCADLREETHSMEDETTSTVVDIEGEEIAFAGGAIGHRRCRPG